MQKFISNTLVWLEDIATVITSSLQGNEAQVHNGDVGSVCAITAVSILALYFIWFGTRLFYSITRAVLMLTQLVIKVSLSIVVLAWLWQQLPHGHGFDLDQIKAFTNTSLTALVAFVNATINA